MIAGPAGSDRPERFIAMMNAERSPTFYRFDSAEQFRVWREMDDSDEEPVVIYHSHTATEAYPSRTDISYASEPQAHYVLVSTRDEDTDRVPLLPDHRRRGHRGARHRGGMIPCPGGLDAKDRPDNPVERCSMAIEVRIPTILRTYTDGARRSGSGSTLGELFIDLEQRHGGLRDRLIDKAAACGASSTCTSTTRTSASCPAWTRRSRTATR